MPSKTLYIKEVDLPLFEQVQEQFGDSVSSMFSEFLRERIGNLDPGEDRIFAVMNEIAAKRETLSTESRLPAFVDSMYAESNAFAQTALKKFKARRIRDSKISLMAAIAYQELADRTLKQVREIGEKINQIAASSKDTK
jgi:hypothetical protein